MSDQKDLSTLQRKAGVGVTQPEGSAMTPVKAFRLAISKAAQVELGLAAQVKTIEEEQHNHAALLEVLDQDALLLMLENPFGSMGVAVLDINVISALIEVQTLGAVIASKANKRAPTRTDSAMCEAVLDQILQRFETLLTDTSAAKWASGFRFDKQIGNVRLLGLALPEMVYRVFQLELNLADGAKTGLLHFIFPTEGPRDANVGHDAGSGWAQLLEKNVGDSNVDISAVLHRVQMTLHDVQTMQTGSLINVPKSAVAKISLEGSDGVVAGNARLGQQNGHRALRLNGGSVEGFPEVGQLSGPSTLQTKGLDSEGAHPEPMTEQEPMIEMANDFPPMADFPAASGPEDLPMMPMADAPLDDLAPMPMAAMPMDVETA